MVDLHDTDVLVLAGGLGKRLRTVVLDRPKSLAEIHGRPFLYYLFDQLETAGCRRVVLCTGDRASQVEQVLRHCPHKLELHFSPEKAALGTAGALGLAAQHVRSDRALVLNGDSFVDTDLQGFADWYAALDFEVGLVAVRVPDAARFGTLDIREDGRINAFVEKCGAASPGWINAGIYMIERQRLAELPKDRAVSLETEIFPQWAAQGVMGAYRVHDRFIDIGTPDSYAAAKDFFAPETGAE